MSKDLVCKAEEIKCNNVIKQYKMFNFSYIAKEHIKQDNPNWPQILGHPYKTLKVEGS